MKIIARVHSPFPEKFGIPRQSGLADVKSSVVFEPEYRVREAFRGIEGFSHLWIIWQFSENIGKDWTPTVRPPKLGGNKRMGVFATRSPFRPNPIGLSAVKLERVDYDCENAPVLYVSGADIMDGTPVYDIKPYLPYADSYPDAAGGFAAELSDKALEVEIPDCVAEKIPEDMRGGLYDILKRDPRPGYQHDPERLYTVSYGGNEIEFSVNGEKLTVKGIR